MARSLFLGPVAAACLLAAPALAGNQFKVTIRGEVESNQFNVSALSAVTVGEVAKIEFLVDENDFVDDLTFPTRGYVIDQSSWLMSFDTVTATLQNPFPAGVTPYFVVRDNDPAVDGFFLNTNTGGFPTGVPTEYVGQLGQINANFSVTYGGGTLPSLNIADAVGFYDFTGLQVFGFTMDDGFFMGAMGLIFTDMTIAPVAVQAVRQGLPNPQSLSGTDPILGTTAVATVDLSTSGHTTAFLIGFESSLNIVLGNGVRLLVNAADPAGEVLALSSQPGPLATFNIPIPNDLSFAGFEVYSQALHAFGVQPFALSNSLDWTLGQ